MAITGDEGFTRFRRNMEDVVTVALNSGKRVSAEWRSFNGSCCPMGAHPKADVPGPGYVGASWIWDISEHDAICFQKGFDGDCPGERFTGAYYELGKLYRARFP